jgi:phosphotransacetylase
MVAVFEQLVRMAATVEPRPVVVLSPYIPAVLRGALSAHADGLAQCLLVGDEGRIHALAGQLGVDLGSVEVATQPDEQEAIWWALDACQRCSGVLVSGCTPLRLLWPAILDATMGLRRGSLLSGVSIFELEELDRPLLLSDGLLVVSPDLEKRLGIVQNAIAVAHKLGIELPRVALVAATEAVDPKSQVSVDAAQITMMAARKQIKGAIVDGPLGFDNAISSRAAQVKGIASEVSGKVDILIAPDLESGNLLLKTLAYLCRGRVLNAVVGGSAPVILSGPDDDELTQLVSIALGVLLS